MTRALRALERWGLLLLQDPRLPSLVGLIAGEPVRGSWWGHPKGGAIFHAAGELDDHPDVASAKLISRKVTFVHRRLWPPLVAVGRAREDWQLRGLSGQARALLRRLDARKTVRASGKPAKELEVRLLAASRQVHTESGAHALELMTWTAFARDVGLRLPRMSPARACAALDDAVAALNAEHGARGRLPWPAR